MLSIIMAAAISFAQPSSAQPGGWTWTLYEGDGPLVLAEEVPDTPRLRNTLECQPGSGVTRLTLYREDAAGGFVTLASGAATTQTQAEIARDGQEPGVAAPLRLDHPVFAAFRQSGQLEVRGADSAWTLTIGAADLAKLRRFSELCAG